MRQTSPPRTPRRGPELAEALRYAQIGTMLVAPMVALGWIGLWADRRYGTGPWLLLAGLLLGMAGGFANFFKLVLPPRPGGRAAARGGESGEGGAARSRSGEPGGPGGGSREAGGAAGSEPGRPRR